MVWNAAFVLINALSAHMIHINVSTIFYTHIEHSPTRTTYIRYYMETHTHTHTHKHAHKHTHTLTRTHTHTHTHTNTHTHTHKHTHIHTHTQTHTHTLTHTNTHTYTHTHTHTHTHTDCSRNWALTLVGAEILWEEEGFQFGFKRWRLGWAVSKVLWEWIPNVGSKAWCEGSHSLGLGFLLVNLRRQLMLKDHGISNRLVQNNPVLSKPQHSHRMKIYTHNAKMLHNAKIILLSKYFFELCQKALYKWTRWRWFAHDVFTCSWTKWTSKVEWKTNVHSIHMYKGDTKKYFTFNHKNYLKIFPEALSLIISLFHSFTKGHSLFQLESWLHTFFQNIEL